MKSQYKSVIVLLLLFLVAGCAQIDQLTEKTSIEIVQPIKNFRDTRDLGEKPYLDVALSVLVTSNKRNGEVIPINVTWNGSNPVICYVVVNQETPCGLLPMYKMGQQTIVVEVEKINHKKVSAKSVFVWEKITGFDMAFLKVAQIAGSQNPTMGMIVSVAAFMFLFAGIVGVMAKSFNGSVVVLLVSIVVSIMVYSYYDPAKGIELMTAFFALISSSFVVALIGYAIFRGYGIRAKRNVRAWVFDPATGREAEINLEEGPYVGPNTASGGLDSALDSFARSFTSPSSNPQIPPYTGDSQLPVICPENRLYEPQRKRLPEPKKGVLSRLFGAIISLAKSDRSRRR